MYSEYLPWNGIFGYVCFFVIDFARIWTYVDPGKFMVYFCLLSFCVVILGTLFCHIETMVVIWWYRVDL